LGFKETSRVQARHCLVYGICQLLRKFVWTSEAGVIVAAGRLNELLRFTRRVEEAATQGDGNQSIVRAVEDELGAGDVRDLAE